MLKRRNSLLLLLLTSFLLRRTTGSPLSDALRPDTAKSRQLAPSQFAMAATRFIVMLPFLPLMIGIPGATAVALPLLMAVQDRLKTVFPNMPTMFTGGSNGNGGGGGGGGGLSNIFSGQGLASIFGGGGGGGQTNTGGDTFRFRRSLKLPSAVTDRFQEVLDLMTKTEDVVSQLSSPEPDCRRQAVCRLHYAFNPTVGSFLGNMLQVLKIERQIEKLDVSTHTRSMLKDAIKAASSGLYRQDCAAIYSRCTVSIPTKVT